MQRYFTNKLIDNYFILNDDDLYHINKVMRMKENDKVEVVFKNNVYSGIITSNGIKKDELLSEEVTLKNITLIIPLLKETKMDLILQKATELGVGRIIPVRMERSIIKLNEQDYLKKQLRWQKICKEASEQSKRTNIPLVDKLENISSLNLDGLNIICSTSENSNTLNNILKNMDKYDKINIAIGPEGGFTKEEEKILVNLGFIKTSLGKLIMRVETVPLYILSVINYLELKEWLYVGFNNRI